MSAQAAAYAATGVYQIVSGIQQGEIVRENAALTRDIANQNADLAEIDAYNAEISGFTQEARYQNVIDATLGAQKVALASQNIDINFGSAKEIQADSKLAGFLNKVDLRNQAHEAALGYKNQARSFRLAGVQADAQGSLNASSARNTALLSAASTATGYFSSRPKV